MISGITAVAVEVADGERRVARAGLGWTTDYGGWSPGWP